MGSSVVYRDTHAHAHTTCFAHVHTHAHAASHAHARMHIACAGEYFHMMIQTESMPLRVYAPPPPPSVKGTSVFTVTALTRSMAYNSSCDCEEPDGRPSASSVSRCLSTACIAFLLFVGPGIGPRSPLFSYTPGPRGKSANSLPKRSDAPSASSVERSALANCSGAIESVAHGTRPCLTSLSQF